MKEQPKVIHRTALVSTPWVTLLKKDVAYNGRTDDFYSLRLRDYVTVVALTPDGHIPLVRQYRPAVEEFTLELPAGLLEDGESAEDCCRRELKEEVGLNAVSLRKIGEFWPDTGRLGNLLHVFFCETDTPNPNFVEEPGLQVRYVSASELNELTSRGEFKHLQHVAAVYLAGLLPLRDSYRPEAAPSVIT